jgi:hypothetical protein
LFGGCSQELLEMIETIFPGLEEPKDALQAKSYSVEKLLS